MTLIAQPATKRPKPWPHQVRAAAFLRDKPGAMLALPMGLGKSRCAIDLIEVNQYQYSLIIAPLSVVDYVWPDQIKAHAQHNYRIAALGSRFKNANAKADYASRQLQIAHAAQQPIIVIVNYEASRSPRLADWLTRQRWECLILDESHRIKSHNSRTSRWIAGMARSIPRRLALTGTPMPHSPLDLFGQFRAIAPEIFGLNFQQFRDYYAIMREINVEERAGNGKIAYRTIKAIDGYRNQDELNRKFYDKAFLADPGESLDLPATTSAIIRVQLSPTAQRLHDQLSKEFIAEMASGQVISATNALTKLLRMHQITSGHAQTDDEQLTKVDSAKANALTDILASLPEDEPIVIFARFIEDLNTIRQIAVKAGRRACEISGRRKELEQWNEKGGVLAVQIQTGSVGIDLTKSRYAIYYSHGYSLGDYLQSMARVHRPGQTRTVSYLHIIAANSVDETIMQALSRKQEVIDTILKSRTLNTQQKEAEPQS